jgi:hypothetical protein
MKINVNNGKISTFNPYAKADRIWKTFISDKHANTWLNDNANRELIEGKHNVLIRTGQTLYRMANITET